MDYITTTQLRTKSKDLVKDLQQGYSVKLVHRSKVVGIIEPPKPQPKVFNAKKVAQIAKKMNLPYLSPEEIDKRYRDAMMKKHGENIS